MIQKAFNRLLGMAVASKELGERSQRTAEATKRAEEVHALKTKKIESQMAQSKALTEEKIKASQLKGEIAKEKLELAKNKQSQAEERLELAKNKQAQSEALAEEKIKASQLKGEIAKTKAEQSEALALEKIKTQKLRNKNIRMRNRKFKESMKQGNERMQELGQEKVQQIQVFERLKENLKNEK